MVLSMLDVAYSFDDRTGTGTFNPIIEVVSRKRGSPFYLNQPLPRLQPKS